MLEHSEIKVELLDRYIKKYLQILSRDPFTKDIFFFDVFSGEGIYENGGKGSPILVLEAVKNTYFATIDNPNAGKFNCFFNDGNRKKIEKLQNTITEKKLHYPEIGSLEFSNEEYKDVLPIIKQKISGLKKDKAFVFIDPYGYKEIRLKDIKDLLQSKKSELLLWLPTQFMFRFEKKGTPECLHEFIKELLPEEEWPKSETGIEFIERLLDSFSRQLPEYFVDSFIISRNTNQFFCLFFFTSHIYGFQKMLESKWELDENEGRGWSLSEGFNLFSEIDDKPNTIKFEKKLREFLKLERTNGEIYSFTLHNRHLITHTNALLKKFKSEGVLKKNDKIGIKNKEGAYYLNYENFKNSSDRLTLKIK